MNQDNRPDVKQSSSQGGAPSRTGQGERAEARGAVEPARGQQRAGTQREWGQRPYSVARRDQDYGMPSLFSGGPFSLLRRMEQEMDRMFEQFGMPSFGQMQGSSNAPSLWAPQVEIFQREGKLHVTADLPGIKKEDVHVDVEDDRIIIQGERRSSSEQGEREGRFYRTERTYGSFYRTIPLPEGVDTQTCDATFRDGVLEVTFDAPKEQSRSRRLEIKDEASQPQSAATSQQQSGAKTSN